MVFWFLFKASRSKLAVLTFSQTNEISWFTYFQWQDMLKFILTDLIWEEQEALPSQPSAHSASAHPLQITGVQPAVIQDPPLHISPENGQRAGMVCGLVSSIKGLFSQMLSIRALENVVRTSNSHLQHPYSCPGVQHQILRQSLDTNNSEAQRLSKIEVPPFILMRYPSWKKFSH